MNPFLPLWMQQERNVDLYQRSTLISELRYQLLWFSVIPALFAVSLALTRPTGSWIDWLPLGISFGTLIVLILVYLVIRGAQSRHVHRLRMLPDLPNRGVGATVRSCVLDLAATLNITPPGIKLQRAIRELPSAAGDSRGSLVAVTSDLLVIASNDIEAARAVLAHELGHIVAKDTWIHRDMVTFGILQRWLVIPLFVLVFAVSLFSGVGLAAYIAMLLVLIAARHRNRLYREIRVARFASEFRADRCACHIADGWSLIRFLNLYVTRKIVHTHPPVDQRISNADLLMMLRHGTKRETAHDPMSLTDVFAANRSPM